MVSSYALVEAEVSAIALAHDVPQQARYYAVTEIVLKSGLAVDIW
jgi:hypothetical protein